MRGSIPDFFRLLFILIPNTFLSAQYDFNFELLKEAKIMPVGEINTPANEASPFVVGENLYFISDRNDNVYDIFYAVYQKGFITNVKSMNSNINSSKHEGPACLCGEDLFYSRSVRKKINGVKSDAIVLMKLAKGAKKAKEFNSNKNLMHLTCSKNSYLAVEVDQNRMTNIVRLSATGEIIKDEQLQLINSAAHDAFPMLMGDSILVFSSKRPDGYGGFDLYITDLTAKGWTKPVALPPPFNTPFDDFGLIIFTDGRSGMISSNRKGGQGGDDIYYWSVSKPFIKYQNEIPLATFEVKLLDKLSDEPVSSGIVKLYSVKDNKSVDQLKRIRIDNFRHDDTIAFLTISHYVDNTPILLKPNAEGLITTQLPSNQHYVLEILSGTHERLFYLLTSEQWTKIEDLTLPLSPLIYNEAIDLTGGEEKKDTFFEVIRGISFESDKLSFSPETRKKMDILLEYYNNNPKSKIEIIAYTSTKSNAAQSQIKTTSQANTLKKWLIFKGIKANQIIAKGGSDTKLINHCARGVICSDTEHSVNERVEIKIWKE